MPVKIGNKEFSDDQVQALVDIGALHLGQKGPNNTDYLAQAAHGFWSDGTTPGLFTNPFAERGALSAIRYPEARLIARLWAGVTDVENPEFEIIGGVDAARGSNATDWCGEAPTAGFLRLCTTRAAFGNWKMQTDSVKLPNIGGRINRGDVDQFVINMPEAFPLTPDMLAGLVNGGGTINTMLGIEVFRYGIHAARAFSRVLFHGSINNTGGGAVLGFMREFNGFDQIITTDHVDLESGTFCPAADSIIENFNNVNVSTGSSNVVELFANIVYQLDARADQGNLGDTWSGFIAMHPDMFHALTAIWPCSYLTDNCAMNNNSGQRVVVGGAEQVEMRDNMRGGKFLWIMGRQIPVETTRGIQRAAQGPGFKSPVYFINDSVPGMERTCYLEGFNMGNEDITQYVQGLPANEVSITNGGFYLSTFNRQSVCLEYEFMAKPRLVHRAPWLCARIENMVYTLPGYSDDNEPGLPYYRNSGGRYVSTGGQTIYDSGS